MNHSNYRDLELWEKSRRLAGHVYVITGAFPSSERFGLTQQMRRASVSIVSNIAEGHGRRTPNDILHFLLMSRGSMFELETQSVIASDLAFFGPDQADQLNNRINECVRLINGLIRHYTQKLPPRKDR